MEYQVNKLIDRKYYIYIWSLSRDDGSTEKRRAFSAKIYKVQLDIDNLWMVC